MSSSFKLLKIILKLTSCLKYNSTEFVMTWIILNLNYLIFSLSFYNLWLNSHCLVTLPTNSFSLRNSLHFIFVLANKLHAMSVTVIQLTLAVKAPHSAGRVCISTLNLKFDFDYITSGPRKGRGE